MTKYDRWVAYSLVGAVVLMLVLIACQMPLR
jgi:intracellular septation protein A